MYISIGMIMGNIRQSHLNTTDIMGVTQTDIWRDKEAVINQDTKGQTMLLESGQGHTNT